MKKIDKKQQLSTVYQNWENALTQANQEHPTYNSSKGEYYNPFEFLEYSPNTHHYIPNTDLSQPVREQIQKMIDVLGINFPNIVDKRRRTVDFIVKYPFEGENQFPTAVAMYRQTK
jgi:hypothetical protein